MGIAKNYYDGLFYNDPIWCIALLCLYHIFLWSHITINVYEEFMCELGRKKTINANYWSWKVVNSYKRERRKPQVSRWLRRHEICISIWLVRSRSGFFLLHNISEELFSFLCWNRDNFWPYLSTYLDFMRVPCIPYWCLT